MNDIEDLKEERMKDLQEQQENQEELEKQKKQQATQLAKQYLTSEAQSRLENVRAARPEQASSIEQQILQLGSTGNLHGKINDSELKEMLKKLNEKGSDYNIKYR